jgi:hypothetical protein
LSDQRVRCWWLKGDDCWCYCWNHSGSDLEYQHQHHHHYSRLKKDLREKELWPARCPKRGAGLRCLNLERRLDVVGSTRERARRVARLES